jgi:hypothetical protein
MERQRKSRQPGLHLQTMANAIAKNFTPETPSARFGCYHFGTQLGSTRKDRPVWVILAEVVYHVALSRSAYWCHSLRPYAAQASARTARAT